MERRKPEYAVKKKKKKKKNHEDEFRKMPHTEVRKLKFLPRLEPSLPNWECGRGKPYATCQ